jgi:glycosyltransferase involved in cell wall biosynthesis
MGYLGAHIPIDQIEEGMRFWRDMGVCSDNSDLIVVFLGTFGAGFDFVPVFQAAKLLQSRRVCTKFIICGAGENAAEIKRQAQECNNVLFPGWINAAQIRALLELADIGIAPYIERRDFINSYPNKAAEYLSGGLAIALSLREGVLSDLLMRRECGFSYENCPDKIAAKLEFLARNPSQLKTLQVNALTTFKESFDAGVVYTRLIKFLEQVARTGHSSVTSRE